MIASPFGDLRYGDRAALVEFLGNHDQAHRDLLRRMQDRGISLQFWPLDGEPDADWFANHAAMHSALARALKLPDSPGMADSSAWQTARGFNNWHQINMNAHILYESILQT